MHIGEIADIVYLIQHLIQVLIISKVHATLSARYAHI